MNIATIGRKYEGKTTLAVFLACRIMDRTNSYKVWMFDPKWSVRNPAPRVGGKTRKFEFTDDIGDFERILRSDGDAAIFRPQISFDKDDEESTWEDFLHFVEAIRLESLLKHPPERPIVIVVDEAYLLQEGRAVHPALAAANKLATEGKIYIIQAAHAPKEIAPKMRRELDELYLFRQDDPVDLDAIHERCGEQCAEIVSSLPLHHVLVFKSRSRSFEVWKHPEGWYSDIGKTPRENAAD